MKNKTLLTLGFIISFAIGYFLNTLINERVAVNENAVINEYDVLNRVNDSENRQLESVEINKENIDNIKLGAFSISLSVKDLKLSREFYEKLGFTILGGSMEQNYLIMKNENALIGLFQDMFEGNILTFNPGWNENAQNIENFDDVRTIQKQLKDYNIEFIVETDEDSKGPASIMLTDPDGNLILIDQHR